MPSNRCVSWFIKIRICCIFGIFTWCSTFIWEISYSASTENTYTINHIYGVFGWVTNLFESLRIAVYWNSNILHFWDIYLALHIHLGEPLFDFYSRCIYPPPYLWNIWISHECLRISAYRSLLKLEYIVFLGYLSSSLHWSKKFPVRLIQ